MSDEGFLKVGQWLRFKAGTCFGEEKDHWGIFIATSDDAGVFVALSATSNVSGVLNFAKSRNINPESTIVVIEPNMPEASFHLSKQTAFDCNRPSIVYRNDLNKWISNNLVELADFNIEVNEELLSRLKDGVSRSPLVPKKYKRLIK